MRMPAGLWFPALILLVSGVTGCRSSGGSPSDGFSPTRVTPDQAGVSRPAWPVYPLAAEQSWQLNLPGGQRFDASALCCLPGGELLTLSDRGPLLYRIQLRPGNPAADLVPLRDLFTPAQLARAGVARAGRYDCEGIARDERGRLYECEEAGRLILRFDPASGNLERLGIDWSPVRQYFSRTDPNASFEGIAVGGGRLYVANERQRGRIIVVDLESLLVEGSFAPRILGSRARDAHYSDLSWFDGALYVLVRDSRRVLKVDPATQAVLAEYDYGAMERAPEAAYRTLYPYGFMEGLAVDENHFWLVTDNNGFSRSARAGDTRPTLFKCRRPDR